MKPCYKSNVKWGISCVGFSWGTEGEIHPQAPSGGTVKRLCRLWGGVGHWWLDSSASSLFLPLSGAPHLILLLAWQRARKHPLTWQRRCFRSVCPSFHVFAWSQAGAVAVRCPASRLQWATALLQGCSWVAAAVVMRDMLDLWSWWWEMCNSRLGLGAWCWVCQREHGVTFVLSEPSK